MVGYRLIGGGSLDFFARLRVTAGMKPPISGAPRTGDLVWGAALAGDHLPRRAAGGALAAVVVALLGSGAHEAEDSPTAARIASVGGALPVKRSKAMAPCATSSSSPSTVG